MQALPLRLSPGDDLRASVKPPCVRKEAERPTCCRA